MRLLTFGAFDLCHLGHIRLLKRCARIANEVHVGLGTDDHVAEYKRAPVISYDQRAATLQELPWVTRVWPCSSHDALPIIEEVAPDLLAVGFDWYDRDYLGHIGATLDVLEALDVGVVFFPREPSTSTTDIRKLAHSSVGGRDAAD
jgi:glycerol-3-phosphate cytidylyltransferase